MLHVFATTELHSRFFISSGENPCDNNNGECSDICHKGPDGAECSCSDEDNYVLANNDKMCVAKNHQCTPDLFVCRNGNCIRHQLLCDLDDDCQDNTDEDSRMCGKYKITDISLYIQETFLQTTELNKFSFIFFSNNCHIFFIL